MSVFKATTTKAKPIGKLVILLAGEYFAERAIWADSTSESELQNELNDLAQHEDAVEMFSKLGGKFTFEINMFNKRETSSLSLADILAAK